MKLIPMKTIEEIAEKLKINTDNYDLRYLQYAASVELEHRDVIGNHPETAMRIALDHLEEFPTYYIALKQMESRLDRQWKLKPKPALFTN